MTLIAEGDGQDLSRLALNLGFFDYSHFSNEFKRSALTTPGHSPPRYGIASIKWSRLTHGPSKLRPAKSFASPINWLSRKNTIPSPFLPSRGSSPFV